MQIRKATTKDIPAIEAMYHDRVLYNDGHDMHQWRLEQVSWECFSQLYTIDDYYVAEENNTIVGLNIPFLS